MLYHPPRRLCITIVLFLGVVVLLVPAAPAAKVDSKKPLAVATEDQRSLQMATSQPHPERIVPAEKGLEKLSPDLRKLLDSQPVLNPGAAAAVDFGSGDPLLVSAMVQPGANVERFFSHSVVTRTVAGVAWVTGETALPGFWNEPADRFNGPTGRARFTIQYLFRSRSSGVDRSQLKGVDLAPFDDRFNQVYAEAIAQIAVIAGGKNE
jgi:hypothetical protein